jgi:nucleotide-binding universal stress UspA family protein
MLVGLDSSISGIAAQELGIAWAKRFDAELVGLAIVDDPGIGLSGAILLSDAFHTEERRAAAAKAHLHAEAALSREIRDFAVRCGDAGVNFRTIEEAGSPHVQILLEAQKHDLILLGQRSHFEYGYQGQAGQTLAKVLRDTPRPVIAVPDSLGEGTSVVVAYDGSLQASRALAAFEAAGLATDRTVHVITADPDAGDAERNLERAIQYLRSHDIEAAPHRLERAKAPAEAILSLLPRVNAGLVVMGAYGQPILKEFFIGSATLTMLDRSPVPLFLFH